MSEPERPSLTVRLTGQHVTEEAVREAGEATRNVLREVARVRFGDPDAVKWQLGAPQRVCDGCGAASATFELADDWANIDGLDYCPACLETGVRSELQGKEATG
jgi:hypothetical protein